ncbi:MAG: DNA adenine methylase [Pyrinomonadaceae bacterium]
MTETHQGNLTQFPYLSPIFGRAGNKSEIADDIWERFGGDVRCFKDPFCGTASILLARPLPGNFGSGEYREQINDADGLVANALRAIREANPGELARECERAYSETDLVAAHRLFVQKRNELEYKLQCNINYFDLRLAGLFIWASRGWIGGRLGDPATAANTKVPNASISRFFNNSAEDHISWLHLRYRRVQILRGDGMRMVSSATQLKNPGITAVVFDPPYPLSRRARVYAYEDPLIARNARLLALELGSLPKYRIAYCGFFSRYDPFFPKTWERLFWKSPGGYYVQGSNPESRKNANDECIWFSPACLKP